MDTGINGTVGIYVRVSTVEQAQEGYSIAAQKERLKAYCKAQGWQDYRFYVDEGISAKDMKRPQLEKLFEHIREGKIKLILVYRLDRFTRSVRDLHKMLEIMEKHGCGFKSATEVYDTTTAMGRLFITIVAALAEWESANSSERIKMALEKKVADGERVGAIPFGFDLNENEQLTPNHQKETVLEIIKQIKSGKSATAIAKFLSATDGEKSSWHPTAIFRILRNPALYGSTRWVDKVFEDTHEGIITKEEFEKIQDLLEERAATPRREVEGNYLFQQKLVCPSCGGRMSVNRYIRTVRGEEVQKSTYRCQKCMKNKEFNNVIGEQYFESALMDYMAQYVVVKQDQPEIVDDKYETLFSVFKSIERKREKYQKGWASDLIDDDEFSRLMKETKEPYEEAKKELQAYRPPVKHDLENIIEFVTDFNENFRRLTVNDKREFIHTFIQKIHFKLIPQPPRQARNKKGKPLIQVTKVDFY